MFPGHSVIIKAEQFRKLAQLYPDRMNLGLERAPRTDQATAKPSSLVRCSAASTD